jgi:hypothetical protein
MISDILGSEADENVAERCEMILEDFPTGIESQENTLMEFMMRFRLAPMIDHERFQACASSCSSHRRAA